MFPEYEKNINKVLKPQHINVRFMYLFKKNYYQKILTKFSNWIIRVLKISKIFFSKLPTNILFLKFDTLIDNYAIISKLPIIALILENFQLFLNICLFYFVT